MLQRGEALLLFFFLRLPTGLTKNENEGESEIFCQIRLLAENDPEKLVFGNEEREKQIMRQIEKVGPEIHGLVGKADQRDGSLIAKFYAIAQEVKRLMENVKDLRREATKKRLSAKRHLHQVIFGEYGGEAEDMGELGPSAETISKIFSGTTFQESCGGKGDTPAGKSLINDFICLCAHSFQKKANDDKSICKYNVDTTVDANFKNWTAAWHENNHRICVNTPPLTPNPQNIRKLVALFERAVEREQTGSQVKGVFGFVNNNEKNECNTTKVGSTCVNYIHTLSHGGIEWVNHLKNASQDLQDMARYAEESESSLPQLEMLEYNALLLYEEAKYSAHLPHATPSNGTDTNSSNESYQESATNSTNSSQEGEFEEEEEGEENKDITWNGRLPWHIFFLMVF
ncbi:Variant surface glycoprotein [Trypanosoma congolense IL3000]|uniref:Variant surface glycoprotein n=1 Tax=Trypanosoma congolense (strain IL3000) TaxID=1068625 RepID=F9W8S8_TRYCI|nr:Variant surface glycoprotein [Trypanosoma congolense IL3000]